MIGEFLELRGQRFGRLAELSVGVRNAGVRVTGNGERGYRIQRPDVIGHQIRTRRAVHSNGEQIVVGDGSVQSVDRLSAEHGAVSLDGHRSDHGNRNAEFAPQLLNRNQGRLEAARIEARLDQEKIAAAFDQRLGLLIVGVAQLRERRRHRDIQVLVGGSHGARDEPGLAWRRELIRRLARQLSRGIIQFVDAVLQIEIGEHDGGPAESVGLNDVRSGFEVCAVDAVNQIRTRDGEDFRAILAAEKIRLDGQRRLVNHGAHGSIDDQNPGGEGVLKRLNTAGHAANSSVTAPRGTMASQHA
jgi:hypothetical protein